MTKPWFQPKSIRLRDGELVVYRRTRTLIYQCRYKLADGTWQGILTGHRRGNLGGHRGTEEGCAAQIVGV